MITKLPAFIAITCLLSAAAQYPANAQTTQPALELTGNGVQVYTCTTVPAGTAWHLQGPDATLTTPAGKQAGRHFAGPSWQATDGSLITGEVLAQNSAAGAVPWLLLRAKSHAGTGLFSTVSYITRTHTSGGTAPSGTCTAGAQVRIPYSASYTFFSGGK